MQQKIIILDFGSQTTQLIGRRVRELDTFCEILPSSASSSAAVLTLSMTRKPSR